MTNRDIRAVLRGATKDGVLRGWYFYGGRGVLPMRYVVSPPGVETRIYDVDGVSEYCEMLLASGIRPVYLNPSRTFND